MSPDIEIAKPGLEGVIAGDTAICCVDQGKLLYRGYPISELAEKTAFGEVAYLLIYGELPTVTQLKWIREQLSDFHGLKSEVLNTLRMIPAGVPMMSVLRTCISMASHFDPVEGQELDSLRRRAIWLLAVASDIVAARYRLLNGKEPIKPLPGVSHAHQMLYSFHGTEQDELSVRLLDMTLVLYAEHDFNASTFTNRVVASTA